jgi:uncharacterized membrane protein
MADADTQGFEHVDTAAEAEQEEVETTRQEALSDGVFAVAITLLAFELTVPAVKSISPHRSLANALADQWPEYLAYALSFATILIMWVNHHSLFRLIKRTDHVFLLLNGLLLMVITAIPFATSLLASFIERPDRNTAQVVYSGLSLVMALTYFAMWHYAAWDRRLLDKGLNRQLIDNINKQFAFGPPSYITAFVLAFFSAQASLALCILLAMYFGLPNEFARLLLLRLRRPGRP